MMLKTAYYKLIEKMNMHKFITAIYTCLLLLSTTAQAAHEDTEISASQNRYFIVGAYLAEIAVALDASDHIVAVSAGSDYIPELKNIPVIEGYRNLSVESILALEPTVALLANRQTRPEFAQQLVNAGIDVHIFPDESTDINIVPARIETIGRILGKEKAADALISDFHTELSDTLDYVSRATSKPRGLFILSGGGRPTVVAGGDTHIALLLQLAGAQNLTQDIKYYKAMSQELMAKAAPEFIVTNQEGLAEAGGTPVALKAPGVRLTPAGRNQHIFSLPQGYLTGLGLMTPKAIRAIAQYIHPELAQP